MLIYGSTDCVVSVTINMNIVGMLGVKSIDLEIEVSILQAILEEYVIYIYKIKNVYFIYYTI